MQLNNGGNIKVDGHLVRRTGDGQWMVSRMETVLGYVDTLDEVAGLIERHRERVRSRLAMAQRKADERKAEERREFGEIARATKIEKRNDDQEWDKRVSELDYAQGDEF